MDCSLCRMSAALFALAFFAAPALAENRIALVIGNSAYQAVTVLPNPANDAKAMSQLLAAAGFEIVDAPDLTQSDLRRTLREFAGKVEQKGPDTVALVYYAGHGLQVDGENFLVPTDARIERESDVPIETVRLADVMNALAATPSRTRIVILDACRNNPFTQIRATTGRGLAIVDAPTGSIVSYSTAPGAEALDGAGANSPFTAALVEIVKEPGLPIEQAFKRVRLAVHQSTNGQQTPWESSSLTGDFAFFAGAGAAQASAGDAVPAARPEAGGSALGAARAQQDKSVQQWRAELQPRPASEAYEIVIREDTVEAYEAFVALHGNTPPMRGLLDRRREMIAWYTAVTLDTVAAYEAFLARFAGSDLAATARRLLERARTRSAFASAPAALGGIRTDAPPPAPPPPTRVSTAPPAACTCPAPPRAVPPPPPTRVFVPPPTRIVVPPPKKKKEPPKKKTREVKRSKPQPAPRRGGRPPTDEEIFGNRRGSAADVIVPLAIGVGVGLATGRRGGGGGGHAPQPSGHHR